MGWFFKSFEEKVADAIKQIGAQGLGVAKLEAKVAGKVVTLMGEATSKEVRARVMELFDGLVSTDNTLNQISVPSAQPKPEPAAAESAEAAAQPAEAAPAEAVERIHEVVSGDTLGGIAKTYYGKASVYMKIFEANKDQLTDPNKIQVGQKLRIPE